MSENFSFTSLGDKIKKIGQEAADAAIIKVANEAIGKYLPQLENDLIDNYKMETDSFYSDYTPLYYKRRFTVLPESYTIVLDYKITESEQYVIFGYDIEFIGSGKKAPDITELVVVDGRHGGTTVPPFSPSIYKRQDEYVDERLSMFEKDVKTYAEEIYPIYVEEEFLRRW